MKARRLIFLILGSILVLLTLMVDLSGNSPAVPQQYKGDTAYTFGFYLGKYSYLMLGIIFLFIAYRAHIKIKARRRDEWLNAFNDTHDPKTPS